MTATDLELYVQKARAKFREAYKKGYSLNELDELVIRMLEPCTSDTEVLILQTNINDEYLKLTPITSKAI